MRDKNRNLSLVTLDSDIKGEEHELYTEEDMETLDSVICEVITHSGDDRLSPQDKAFAMALLKGEVTQEQAYRDAFGIGDTLPRNIVATRASKLKNTVRIQNTLSKATQTIDMYRARSIQALGLFVKRRLVYEAQDTKHGTASSRVKALSLLGDTIGMFSHASTKDPRDIPTNPADIMAEMSQLLDRVSTPVSVGDVGESKES